MQPCPGGWERLVSEKIRTPIAAAPCPLFVPIFATVPVCLAREGLADPFSSPPTKAVDATQHAPTPPASASGRKILRNIGCILSGHPRPSTRENSDRLAACLNKEILQETHVLAQINPAHERGRVGELPLSHSLLLPLEDARHRQELHRVGDDVFAVGAVIGDRYRG